MKRRLPVPRLLAKAARSFGPSTFRSSWSLEGIAWRFRTGSPWRDLPDAFGAYQSVWQRHRLWSTDGTYERMFAAVGEQGGLDPEEVEPILSIDSTVVRAHQHAAGARRDSVVTDPTHDTGGRIELQEKSGVVPGEPPDHALGRSRGGLTTKVHALSDASCTPVLAMLTAGQAGDNPMLAPLIEALAQCGHDLGFRLLADKAYSHPSTRTYLPRHVKVRHQPRTGDRYEEGA